MGRIYGGSIQEPGGDETTKIAALVAGPTFARATRTLYNGRNMKTIAITIDDETLARLDRVRGNRSKLIREAVREHLARRDRLASDQQEARIVRRHRSRLARQARVLVRSQAKP